MNMLISTADKLFLKDVSTIPLFLYEIINYKPKGLKGESTVREANIPR